MRKDFSKVLCECYRGGRAWADSSGMVRSRIKASRHDDEGVYFSSRNPARSLRHRHKYFGEHLAPLKRYIAAQIGRPWNKVYSEISAVCKPQGAVGLHIYQHLYDYIAVQVEADGDQWCCADGWRRYTLSRGDLFVDPEDGIIKRIRRRPAPYRKSNRKKSTMDAELTFLQIDELHSYERIRGLWYKVQWLPMVDEPEWKPLYDCRTGEKIGRATTIDARFPACYPAGKRQLGRKELCDQGLVNRPQPVI